MQRKNCINLYMLFSFVLNCIRPTACMHDAFDKIYARHNSQNVHVFIVSAL